jgi:hypothetical protein
MPLTLRLHRRTYARVLSKVLEDAQAAHDAWETALAADTPERARNAADKAQEASERAAVGIKEVFKKLSTVLPDLEQLEQTKMGVYKL